MNFGSEIVRDYLGTKDHLKGFKVVNIGKTENYNLNVCYNPEHVEETMFFVVNCDKYRETLSTLFYGKETWLDNNFYFADFGLNDIVRELKFELFNVPAEVLAEDKKRTEEYGVLTHRIENIQGYLLAKAQIAEYRPLDKYGLVDAYSGEILIKNEDVPDFTEETVNACNELFNNYPMEITSFCGWYRVVKPWYDFINHCDHITYAYINEECTKCFVTTTTWTR